MSSDEINNELLIAYAAGNLPQEDAARVESRIAHDAAAKATVARYRLAASVRQNDDTVEPPAGVVAKAKAIFRPIAQPARSLRDAVQTVIARLIYDSRLQPAAVRAGDAQRRVQLTYAAEDIEIELQAERDLQSGGGRWRVTCQITGDELPQDIQIVISPAGVDQTVFERTIEGDEMFSLNLASGTYEIRANIGNAVMVIPEMVLK